MTVLLAGQGGSGRLYRAADDGSSPSEIGLLGEILFDLAYHPGRQIVWGRAHASNKVLAWSVSGARTSAWDYNVGQSQRGITVNGDNLCVYRPADTMLIAHIGAAAFGTTSAYTIASPMTTPVGMGWHPTRGLMMCDSDGDVHAWTQNDTTDTFDRVPGSDVQLTITPDEQVRAFDVDGTTAWAVVYVPVVGPPHNIPARHDVRTYTIP